MVHRGMALRLVKTTHNNMFAASKSGSVEAKDPQFNYVTMLLHGNGTNGAQNNTFVDSSTNNFSITRNGNTTQGTFAPYGSNWSNYFNGSNQYVSVPANTAFAFGTGDFTIECWVYLNAYNGTYGSQLAGGHTYGVGADFLFNVNTTGKLYFQIGGSGTGAITSTNSVSLNTWTHIAIVRASGVMTPYINGVNAGGSATYSTSIGSTIAYSVGDDSTGNAGSALSGYISNHRTVKGTAVYTGAFTPPTAPLTAISGTSLLTCQSNRFIDNSSNAFTITAGNSPSVQRFSPFSPTAAYTTSVIGGSGYFDGSGDYLTAPQNAAFNIGTGQFTVECFIYWNGTTLPNGGYGLINLGNGANGGGPYTGWGLILDFDSGGKPTFYRYDGTVYSYQSSTNPTANQWIHIAVSRNSSNTLSIWMNGTRVYTGTVTTSFNNVNTNPLNIGYRQDGGTGGTHYFPGYITDARVVVGTDVYGAANSTITVPTAPLTAVSNTQFLLNYTNAAILDNAMMNDLETVGNAQISTSVKKYGTGSIALDGTGDYLNCANPSSVIHQLGTGDFTVEFWAYLTNSGNDNGPIFDTRSSSGNGLLIRQGNGAGGIANRIDAVINASATASSGTISFNTWFHLAVVRSSGTLKVYYNGTGGTGVTATGNITGTNAYIGAFFDSLSINIAGYFDDFRVTKGVARYTSNFTAPTVAFADKG